MEANNNITKDEINSDSTADKSRKKLSGAQRAAAIAGFSLVGAAAVVLIITMIIGFFGSNGRVSGAQLESFENEKQIFEKLGTIIEENRALYSGDAKYLKNIAGKSSEETVSGADPTNTGLTSNNSAYAHYSNVDEADIVKTDDKYIYFLSSNGGGKITVFTAQGKKSLPVSEIALKNNAGESFVFREFFLSGNRLIALEEASGGSPGGSPDSLTRVEIFDISDINNIKAIDKFTQSGSYCSSMLKDGKLCLASTHHASGAKDLPCAVYGDKTISTGDEADADHIPAKDVYYVENPNEPNFLVLSSINTNESAKATKTMAVLGSADEMYCSENYMYISAREYNYDLFRKENSNGASYTHLPVTQTQIVKIDLKNDFGFIASAKVSGYVDSQYSFDEKDGYLRVASTVTLDNELFTDTVNIFVLDKNLDCVGKVTDFSGDESVKAVQYIGDTAYVITYRETDPLFIIDLKNAQQPKVLGEVTISGFSSMLVPVDDNTLLGIGYHTREAKDGSGDGAEEGLKLVTFDISNRSKPEIIDEKIYRDYESPVQYNPKALLVNSQRGDYTIPLTYGHYDEQNGRYETKCGALNFRVDGGLINIIDGYSSSVFVSTPEVMPELNRCAYVNGDIYLLGSAYNYYKAEGNAIIDSVEYK